MVEGVCFRAERIGCGLKVAVVVWAFARIGREFIGVCSCMMNCTCIAVFYVGSCFKGCVNEVKLNI